MSLGEAVKVAQHAPGNRQLGTSAANPFLNLERDPSPIPGVLR